MQHSTNIYLGSALTAVLALLMAAPVRAEDKSQAEDDEPDAPSLPDAPPTPTQDPEGIDGLRDKMTQLEERLKQKEELSTPPFFVNLQGYIDFGGFVPSGDGSGIIQDFGNKYVPGLAGKYGWVFIGDLLAPAVNSRG